MILVLYLNVENGNRIIRIILVIYIDDGLLAADCKEDRRISHKSEEGVKDYMISQQAYTKSILKRFGFENCKLVSTPMLKSRQVLNQEKLQRCC